MVVAVAVVEAQNSAVVHMATFQVDVGQVISNNLTLLKPDLLFERRSLALAFKGVDLRRHGLDRFRLSAHIDIVSQKGYPMSLLLHSTLVGVRQGGRRPSLRMARRKRAGADSPTCSTCRGQRSTRLHESSCLTSPRFLKHSSEPGGDWRAPGVARKTQASDRTSSQREAARSTSVSSKMHIYL